MNELASGNAGKGGGKPARVSLENAPTHNATAGKTSTSKSDPEMMRFKECAHDANCCVKTITRWVDKGFITEWRPYPGSRTRRIRRHVWAAFKQRHRPSP